MRALKINPPVALYVHVPFCAQKCSYCAFYSEASQGELIHRYAAALVREIDQLPPGFSPRTIFFGGGTPSILNLKQWETILDAIRRRNWRDIVEWTVECNPATVSLDKARLWKAGGINRVSMGVQSLDETLLERLGRIHSREQVFKSFDILRQGGFENLNIDLMFAVPGQTAAIWKNTLGEALAMESEHVACYEVIYEEDTPLFRQLQAGEIALDEDLACAQYEMLIEAAHAAGLRQYEVANFARDRRGGRIPDCACLHNINYWKGGGYHALGPSASGFVDGVRTKNWSNTQMYCEQVESGRSPVESRDPLAPLARAGEIAAFGLRMNCGWEWNEFIDATGFDLRVDWAGELLDLESRGWAERRTDGFRLSSTGLRFADAAGEIVLKTEALCD